MVVAPATSFTHAPVGWSHAAAATLTTAGVTAWRALVVNGGLKVGDSMSVLGTDLALPYPWLMRNGITIRGQWMYPARANVGMVRLIRAGLIDLASWEVATFGLDQASEAVAAAATSGGPFKIVVLTP